MVDRIQYGRRLPIGKMCVHVFLTTGHMICGPEDTEKDATESIQEMTRDYSAKVDKVMAAKEKDVMTV